MRHNHIQCRHRVIVKPVPLEWKGFPPYLGHFPRPVLDCVVIETLTLPGEIWLVGLPLPCLVASVQMLAQCDIHLYREKICFLVPVECIQCSQTLMSASSAFVHSCGQGRLSPVCEVDCATSPMLQMNVWSLDRNFGAMNSNSCPRYLVSVLLHGLHSRKALQLLCIGVLLVISVHLWFASCCPFSFVLSLLGFHSWTQDCQK